MHFGEPAGVHSIHLTTNMSAAAAPQSRLTAWDRKVRDTKALCEAFCTHAASVSVQPSTMLATTSTSSDASRLQVVPLVSAVDAAAATFVSSVDVPFLLRALALPLPIDVSDTFRRATVLLFRSRPGLELLASPEVPDSDCSIFFANMSDSFHLYLTS